MRASATVRPAKELSESQRKALINLLGDDDPAIYETVREKILSFGDEAGESGRQTQVRGEPEAIPIAGPCAFLLWSHDSCSLIPGGRLRSE